MPYLKQKAIDMFLHLFDSLKHKLLLALLVVGFIPLLLLLSYTIFFARTDLIDQTIKEHEIKSLISVKLINEHLQSIHNQISTLASLEIMNDLITDDVDKRISQILFKQVRGLQEDIDLFSIKKDTIIASSSIKLYQKQFLYTNLLTQDDGFFIQNRSIYFYKTIYSSFDKSRTLGVLILKYNLKNLKKFLLTKNGVTSYIKKSTSQKKIDLQQNSLIIRHRLSSPLQGYAVVYNIDKNRALAFINQFITLLTFFTIIILALIVFMSIKLSKTIITPLEQFTKTTNYIVQTQDYSVIIEHYSSKELNKLTQAFNQMLQTTHASLKQLEKENKLRLTRLIQLIQTLNKIVNTSDEDTCIKYSISELQKITQSKVIFQTQNLQKGFNLYVTDFKNRSKLYYGSLLIEDKNLHDRQEIEFYNAIASMISLQLDRIRLIENIESASKSKSSFISNMSHELRTPLNSIIGATQYLLTYENLDDTSIQTVATIESSAQYLLVMINDILDIAKIEAGKMEVHFTPCDIKEVVTQVFDILEPLAKEKNLLINLDTSTYSSPTIETDVKILQQIIMNLLSNAIKFTQKGKIDIQLYNNHSYVTIEIQDTGIGIAKENLESIFEEFTQVENIMQKKHKGTGIGLSLSQKMAHLINGKIELDSKGTAKGTVAKLQLRNKSI